MAQNWREVESLVKPDDVDKTSTSSGVYVRKNIEKVTVENDSGSSNTKYTYLECLMTETEYNNYVLEKNIINSVLDEDDTEEYQDYKNQLDEPVQYTNGFYYKPSYISDYKGIMDDLKIAIELLEKAGADTTEILSKEFTVFDATGTPENAVQMTMVEVINLYLFLYAKKEELYSSYKQAKSEAE